LRRPTQFPFKYDNYDKDRKELYDRCSAFTIDYAVNQMHLQGSYLDAEHLAHTSCNNEFNKEDAATHKYDQPQSPLQGLQNFFGGLLEQK